MGYSGLNEIKTAVKSLPELLLHSLISHHAEAEDLTTTEYDT